MHDVITFGSASIDIFAETADEHVFQIDTHDRIERLIAYPSGAKLLVDELHIHIGGGGTNTAAALRKLGLSVAYCGSIGQDRNGDDILSWLEQEGIRFLGTRCEKQTNLSIVLDSKRLHDRTILIHKDASDFLCVENLNLQELAATWYYFPSLMGESERAMVELMRHANDNGIAVAFNPSMYQCKGGLAPLREALERSQLFVLNRDEAECLVGHGSREELCARLRREGGEIVLITDGAEGSTLLYGDVFYHVQATEGLSVVETTGAGDCFASTFLAGLTLQKDPQEALLLATINAESLIGHVGAKEGLLSLEEALARLAQDTRVVTKQNL